MNDAFTPIAANVNSAKTNVEKAEVLVARSKTLAEAKGTLDNLLSTIQEKSPNKQFTSKAEMIYKDALVSLGDRQVDQVTGYIGQLSSINNNISTFHQLSLDAERTYSSIRNISKDRKADAMAEEAYSLAKQYVYAAEVPGLEDAVRKLTDINTTLNEEYTLYITGANDRLWGSANGRQKTYCYIFVEAKDQYGQPVEKDIKDFETGKTERVSKWAEEAPEDIFLAVIEDKQSDGDYDRDKFSIKRKGYLDDELILTQSRGVQMSRQRRNERVDNQ